MYGYDANRGYCVPLVKCHDSWALVGEDGLVRVNAGIELVAELASLDDGAGMAWETRRVSSRRHSR
jgi:hypothetical protein